jgi:hypothetical protein
MVQIYECHLSSTPIQSKHFGYISFLQFFLLFPLMSVSVDFFLFLYFQDDLEYRCILMFQEAFVEYDQTITNNVVLALMIHQGTKIEHK